MSLAFTSLFGIFWILQYPNKVDSVDLPVEAFLKVPEIVSLYGYPSEIHTTLTSDGYYLEMHRIANNEALRNGTKPILIIHGLFFGSFGWVLNKPNNSLGFLLHDSGFDVWMNNFRGNSYSRQHIKRGISEKEYWDFNVYNGFVTDLTALIDYVLNVTKQDSLILLPHSIGNLISFMLLSSKPEYNTKVKGFVGLAPMTTALGFKGTPLLLAPLFGELSIFFSWFGIHHFLPQTHPGILVCHQIPILCRIVNFLFDGIESPNFDPTSIPVVYSHFPEPISSTALQHLLQILFSQKFAAFDYGPAGNKKNYNSTRPPYFNVQNIRVNAIFLYGTFDNLGTPKGVKALSKIYPNLKRMQEIRCSHLDFAFAKNYKSLVFVPIINAIKELLAL